MGGAHIKRPLVCEACGADFLGIDEPNHRARYCRPGCASSVKIRAGTLLGRAGAENPAWKGGLTKSTKGYWYVKMPGHPRAGRNGYVKRADLVLAEKLGRTLMPGELAHHIDENKENDAPENLALHTVLSHAALHAAAKKKPKRLRPPRREAVPIDRLRELRAGHSLRAMGRMLGLNYETIRKRLLRGA